MPDGMKCLICDEEITPATNSGEHLLPASIGGRKEVQDLLHVSCNAVAGDTWDAELARQLQPLSLIFRISRQRGGAPPMRVVTTAGEAVTIAADGSISLSSRTFEKSKQEDGSISYNITARTSREAREMLEGLRRKHTDIDVEAIMSQVQLQERYLDGLVIHDIGLGGEVAGRSIVKSCVAMAFAGGLDWAACNHAVAYLRDRTAEPCFGYYHARDLVKGRVPGMPLHCLAVEASPSTGLIIAYAEYFGIHRVVACLGEGYSGPHISDVYAIDPRNGQKVAVSVDLDFKISDLAEIYDYQHTSREMMLPVIEAMIGPAMRSNQEQARQRALHRAMDKAFDECGAKVGEPLTEQHAAAIAASVAEEMARLIIHMLRPMPEPDALMKSPEARRT